MRVTCPKCASNDYIRLEGLGGDLRGCLACGFNWYVEDDYWQVYPPPLWSLYTDYPREAQV